MSIYQNTVPLQTICKDLCTMVNVVTETIFIKLTVQTFLLFDLQFGLAVDYSSHGIDFVLN